MFPAEHRGSLVVSSCYDASQRSRQMAFAAICEPCIRCHEARAESVHEFTSTPRAVGRPRPAHALHSHLEPHLQDPCTVACRPSTQRAVQRAMSAPSPQVLPRLISLVLAGSHVRQFRAAAGSLRRGASYSLTGRRVVLSEQRKPSPPVEVQARKRGSKWPAMSASRADVRAATAAVQSPTYRGTSSCSVL